MNGRMFLICVLLIVLAIPLFADHALVNPVSELSAISTINSQEVNFTDQELFDSNVPVLDVGIKKFYLYNMAEAKVNFATENGTYNVDHSRRTGFNNSKRGGNLRIASGH